MSPRAAAPAPAASSPPSRALACTTSPSPRRPRPRHPPRGPLLAIPENYYEDLGARFGLDDAELKALEERNLLYDRYPANGTFRHAYTRSFRDRFFFEIVERGGGYAGFGAGNAAVRMAAQRRGLG